MFLVLVQPDDPMTLLMMALGKILSYGPTGIASGRSTVTRNTELGSSSPMTERHQHDRH
jgi:hypothetical protein